jgi:hypothetical protein
MQVKHRYETTTRWGLFILGFACVVVVLGVTYRKADNAQNATASYAPVSTKLIGLAPTDGAVHYGQSVTARVQFCNTEAHPVLGSASLNWQAVDPQGTNLVEPGQAATLYAGNRYERPAGPGCTEPRELDFVQPAEVAVIDRELNARGVVHKWRVSTGFTPIRDNGFGKIETFESPPFLLVP